MSSPAHATHATHAASGPGVGGPTPRALIAEDEPLLAAALERELAAAWPALRIVARAADGPSASAAALAELPDILFLDIQMPGASGLEVAAEVVDEWPEAPPGAPATGWAGAPPPARPPLIVFVTAFEQHALAAFERAAVDYLLKPVTPARLAQAVKRLQERWRDRCAELAAPPPAALRDGTAPHPTAPAAASTATNTATNTAARAAPAAPPGPARHDAHAALVQQMQALQLALAQASGGPQHTAASPLAGVAPAEEGAWPERIRVIRAGLGQRVRMIPLDEVIYFEAADKYVSVVTEAGDALVRISLRELAVRLDGVEFTQVHRSVLVNAQRITGAERDEGGHYWLTLRGLARPLKVSRAFSHLFRPM